MQSPALLLRSGIGPAQELAAHGIAVNVAAEGVGKNLQEHASVALSYFSKLKTYNTMMGPLGMASNFLQYVFLRKGLMTMAPVEAMGFLRSDPSLKEPDIKMSFGAMAFDHASGKPQERAPLLSTPMSPNRRAAARSGCAAQIRMTRR